MVRLGVRRVRPARFMVMDRINIRPIAYNEIDFSIDEQLTSPVAY